MGFLIFDKRFTFLQEVTKRKVLILVITSQNGMLTVPHGFHQFWQYLSCNLQKKLLVGVFVSLNNRIKYIKVTYVFRSPAGRFTVESKEYGNALFSCFDLFITFRRILLWIQGLKSSFAASYLLY